MDNVNNYAVAVLSGGSVVTRWEHTGCQKSTDMDAFFAPLIAEHFPGETVVRAAVCEMQSMTATLGSLPFECVGVFAKSAVPAGASMVFPFGVVEQDLGADDLVVVVDPAQATP